MSNINKKPIPHRVYNPSKEHPYVAGAVDIIDDAKNKHQQKINAETDSSLAYHQQQLNNKYNKDETYSQGEVDEIASAFTSQKYVTVEATDQTTAADIPALINASGRGEQVDTIYRVGSWDCEEEEYNPAVYSEYAWSDINNAYHPLDVKEYTLATAEDFIEPDAEKRVKIPTVGAVADVHGYYEENPEFYKVELDSEGKIICATKKDGTKYFGLGVDVAGSSTITTTSNQEFLVVFLDNSKHILFGIQKDGDILFGKGVPRQFIDYIEKRFAEYDDAISFLGDLIEGGETLEDLLNKKLDGEYIDNQEFLKVDVDADNKVIEGVKKDGTKVFESDVQVFGSLKINKVTYVAVSSPEWLKALVDVEGKVICGIKRDGKIYGDIASIPSEVIKALDIITADVSAMQDIVSLLDSIFFIVQNLEYISVELDSDKKLLSSRGLDGVKREYAGFCTPYLNINGSEVSCSTDPEGRIKIETDADKKILSYRDDNGVLHENIGIKSKQVNCETLELSNKGITEFKDQIDAIPDEKNWYLPKFGKVNIKQETFYLTADSRWSTKNDVVCIQMLDDTSENAAAKRTLSYYYIKSTLDQLPGGGYDRTSVNENSVRLDFYAAKEVKEISGVYYVKSTLEDGQPVASSVEVTQVVDVPPYKAWIVDKDIEHYCLADIDFGTFYSKNNSAVSIKYQGSGSLGQRKRNLRLTFYKNNTYAKKDKVKIGEMVRLSGYNMKSFFGDSTYIKDPIFNFIFLEMWENRGKDCYPWNKDSVPYSGATGMIKQFPIETWFGDEFFGLQFFGLKKDEKNYMLDGDDDASGIFVEGYANNLSMWHNVDASTWIDDLEVDGRELAYPDILGDESVSVETAAAMNEMFAAVRSFIAGYSDFKDANENVYPIMQTTWVDGTYYVTSSLDDGQVTPSSIPLTGNTEADASVLDGYLDINGFIDYWIGLQVFQLVDNEYHNLILHTRADKKMFYPFFYDMDEAMIWPYDVDFMEARTNPEYAVYPYNPIDMSFWEKFTDEFKDSIINRYAELRKSVLTIKNIKSIYETFVGGIPDRVIDADKSKWVDWKEPKNFEECIEFLDKRLTWLDENYFCL